MQVFFCFIYHFFRGKAPKGFVTAFVFLRLWYSGIAEPRKLPVYFSSKSLESSLINELISLNCL